MGARGSSRQSCLTWLHVDGAVFGDVDIFDLSTGHCLTRNLGFAARKNGGADCRIRCEEYNDRCEHLGVMIRGSLVVDSNRWAGYIYIYIYIYDGGCYMIFGW